MRIKKLEIHGFKSFGERTALTFGPGISGVVGPNGCGKSNVVDAIRWCMGEMSAKHLRGRAMQDVIFAGSDSRGASGFAEVTLVFHNDGQAPPQYADYTEIAVTRRLHRDGTSEYAINKVPVRLRDITDLFLGTGVGTRAYSIIEQGRIGFVVNARPEERRTLIEEVAGITKFKARRKAAERRLEATEQNLLRVNDIISELERQLATLRRQARKAERYKELKAELRDLDLHAATVEYLRLATVEQMQRAEQGKLQTRLEDAQRALGSEEADVEAERLRLLENERQVHIEQEASAELDTRLAALERDLAHWRQQLDETRQRVAAATEDLGTSRRQLEQTRSERAELAASTETWRQQTEGFETAIAELAEQVHTLQDAVAAVDAELETVRDGALEHVHGAAQQKTLLSNLGKQRDDLTARLDAARRESEQLGTQRAQAEQHHAQLRERTRVLETQMATWSQRAESVEQALEEVRAQVHTHAQRIAALKDELSVRRSRLASLEEIAERMEGYSDGVRTLMAPDAAETGTEPPAAAISEGIKAVVTDILEAAPEYETAIEAALGERLQYLVVDGEHTATQAIAHLKAQRGGCSGFVPLAPRTSGAASTNETLRAHTRVVGPALDLVSVKPGYEPAAEWLLGRSWIVRSLEDAVQLWRQEPELADAALVTLDGDVLDAAGVLSGGSDHGTGLLAKKREIRELQERVQSLEAELTTEQHAHEQLAARQQTLESEQTQLQQDLRAAELEKLGLDKDEQSTRRELERMAERSEVLSHEMQQHETELQRIDAEERAAVEAAQKADASRQEAEARLETLQQDRRRQAEQLEAKSNELTQLRVRDASNKEKLTSAEATLNRLQSSEHELQQRIARDEQTIQQSNAQITELEERIAQSQATAEEVSVQAQQRREQLAEARRRYDADRAKLGEVEEGLRTQRRDIEHVQEALMQAKMDLQKLDLERQRLLEQVAEKHDEDLRRVLTDYHHRPLPTDADAKRRAEIERSLKNIGPINLTAIDECAEVERRHGFLNQQREDLLGALESLRRAIQRINRASRERFKEAFDSVNEMFQQVFPRLFRGGEARLVLTESDDVLEAGVDIVAMPPGKKAQSVSLLSGGEKALTATSLVFAIFLIKPSPFCVLDEVDAPLDDANVGRFNEMLGEISQFSQFIVITHNKETMQAVDRLYGITMEEPGLSKVVSVDLQEKDGEERAA